MGKNKSPATITLVLLDMTPELLVSTTKITMVMVETTTSVLLTLEIMDTTLVLSARTRRSKSVTSILMRTLARSPKLLARRLLTPSTSRSVRRLSTLFVMKLTNSITTVNMLPVTSQLLLLVPRAIMRSTMVRAMVMVIRKDTEYYSLLLFSFLIRYQIYFSI